MKNEALYKGFENIPTRRGRGGSYSYIRWQDVADRMNEVFGTNWSSEVMSQDIIGANIIVRVRVSVYDPTTQRVSIQEGFGGAPNDAANEAGNPFKSAYSKALKDACKKWGVGLYLDEDEDNSPAGNPVAPSIPTGYIGKEVGVPPTPPISDQGPVFTPLPPESVLPVAPILMEDPGVFVPTPPTSMAPPVPSGGMPLPPGVAMGLSTQPMANSMGSPPPTTPYPESPPTPPKPISLKDDMPMSKVNTIHTGEPEYISDVQKAALQSILSIKGVEYEALAQEAFEFNGLSISPIPSPDKLTYQEAVYVVKYGNDKFRKR